MLIFGKWRQFDLIRRAESVRTTLDLDDQLMERLAERFPDASKTARIERAINEFLYQDAIKQLGADVRAGKYVETAEETEAILKLDKEAEERRARKLGLWVEER